MNLLKKLKEKLKENIKNLLMPPQPRLIELASFCVLFISKVLPARFLQALNYRMMSLFCYSLRDFARLLTSQQYFLMSVWLFFFFGILIYAACFICLDEENTLCVCMCVFLPPVCWFLLRSML